MATPLHTSDVCLLSLERCRALLPPDCELNDVELERLRDGLYALAGVAVEGFLAQSGAGQTQTAPVDSDATGQGER